MRRYLPFAIIGAIFLIAIGSGLVLFRSKQPISAPIAPIPPVPPIVSVTPVGPSVQTALAAPVMPQAESESLHVRGGAQARVTIEEFGDFQCIPCAEAFSTLARVEEDYGERLRIVFRHKPMRKHEHAVVAACAAEAAGLQGRFWEMHALLFQNSPRWTKGIDTVGEEATPSLRSQSKVLALDAEVRDVFLTYAERLNLDVDRFRNDIDSSEVKARVESDRALGDARGIDRTPTFYLNGRLLRVDHRNADAFHTAIDAELNGKGNESAAPSTSAATPEQPK